MAVLGVDGWRGRWVAARLEGRAVRLEVHDRAASLLAVPDVEVVGVDMPIGLSDDGVRACDVAARRLLGRAGSSVFPAPVRPVLDAADYAAARTSAVAASGRSLSAQAFQLVAAIRDLDDALGDRPDPRVAEVHPELSFRALDDRVRDRKGTARGTVQRLRALRAVMDVEEALTTAPTGVPVIDALDACAVAWSAQRIAGGRAESVGDDARDARGRLMRISW